MSERPLRHRVLVHLADEGSVEDPGGHVTTLIAAAVNASPSQVGMVLRQLHIAGHLTRDHNPISGRTFRAVLTQEGREQVARGAHIHHAVRRPKPLMVAAMPVPGAFSRVPFDQDRAREAAMGGAL